MLLFPPSYFVYILYYLKMAGFAEACCESNPITGLERPIEFQEAEAPRFQDNRHMNVVRLSALRTGRLYPTGIIPGTHFCWGHAVAQWLRHCATNRKDAGSIPDGVTGIFH
jgi:hypothetical protein